MRAFLLKFAVVGAVILCAIWYAQSHSYRDPGSIFFDETRAYEQRYSLHRKEEVKAFIASLEESSSQALSARDSIPALCVALSSVKREHAQYLDVTVGSLLHGLTPKERADLHVAVLIAETSPEVHPSWNEEWLRAVVDDVYTYNISLEHKHHLEKLKETGAYSQKGVFDYTYGLQRCYETGAPYIATFEDDILLADGWLVRTLQGLAKLPAPEDEGNPWLFVRLFNQERSTGWANQYIGGNNEGWISAGIGLGISAIVYLARRRFKAARTFLDLETMGLLVLVLNPALVVLFFGSGKATMLPPSPGVFDEPFGCCSQALVFPRTRIPLLMEYLQEKRQGQIDLLLDDFAHQTGLARHALYPVQVQHIGLESSRMTLKNEAQAIWSMAYEDLNPTTLQREHRARVKQYYRAQ